MGVLAKPTFFDVFKEDFFDLVFVFKEEFFDIRTLKAAGFTSKGVHTAIVDGLTRNAAGFTFKEAHTAICDDLTLNAAGFTSKEVHTAITKAINAKSGKQLEMALAELKAAGFTARRSVPSSSRRPSM